MPPEVVVGGLVTTITALTGTIVYLFKQIVAEKDKVITDEKRQKELLTTKLEELGKAQGDMAIAFKRALEIIEEDAHERRAKGR